MKNVEDNFGCYNNQRNMFAISKDKNAVIHISELKEDDRGKNCNCICPNCGSALVAKMGNVRIHHFSHLSDALGASCSAQKANESALHKLAKDIIKRSNYIWLPAVWLEGTDDPSCNIEDSKQTSSRKFFDSYRFVFDSVETEKGESEYIPDIKLKSTKLKKELCVEIAVTHFVDSEKKVKIEKSGKATIEIDLSEFYQGEEFDRDELKRVLLESTDSTYKKWLYNRKIKEKCLPELQERNKKFQIIYQKKEEKRQILIQQKEEKLQNWKWNRERQKRLCKENSDRVEKNSDEYIKIRDSLRNDKDSENIFHCCDFYYEATRQYGGIPFFCNIPVTGEIAFKCDRRVWQILLFDKFFYHKQSYGKPIRWKRIYMFFYKCKKDLLNQNFVDIGNNPDYLYGIQIDDFLSKAIKEYLIHLSGLGFLSPELWCDGYSDFIDGYGYCWHTIIPPEEGKIYADLLRKALLTTKVGVVPLNDLYFEMFHTKNPH